MQYISNKGLVKTSVIHSIENKINRLLTDEEYNHYAEIINLTIDTYERIESAETK